MKLADVRARAFAMPLNDPAYPKGPYKFYNREFVVITYRTDPERLRAVVPEPLEPLGDTVNYEFSRRTMEEHWKAGHSDMARTLRHPEVLQRPENREGVFTFDLAQDGRE